MDKHYIVIKRDELQRLTSADRNLFNSVIAWANARIDQSRVDEGKHPLSDNHYIVINRDEYYAAQVLDIMEQNGHGEDSLLNIPKVNQGKSISMLVSEAHQNAENKGWWEENRSFAECIALVHSELSEALEDIRAGKSPNQEWYTAPSQLLERVPHLKEEVDFSSNGDEIAIDGYVNTQPSAEWKPCGVPSELADVVIRIFDMAGRWNIDLERAISEKMAYNATRPQRHGGKVL